MKKRMTKEAWAWLVLWLTVSAMPSGLCFALVRLAGAAWWMAGLAFVGAFVMTALGLALCAISSVISEVKHGRTSR